jgi:BMFP domain-containing protein YqiC
MSQCQNEALSMWKYPTMKAAAAARPITDLFGADGGATVAVNVPVLYCAPFWGKWRVHQHPPHHVGAKVNQQTNRTDQMDMNSFFNDLQSKINQAIESTPAKDIEKNVKTMMTQGFSKLDLVTREEFDIQTQVLAKTRAKLDALEAKVAELEALLEKPQAVSLDK